MHQVQTSKSLAGNMAKSKSLPVDTRRGLTLVEILILLCITGAVVSLMAPWVLKFRELARHTSCQNHLRQLVQAMHEYHDSQNQLPPAAIWSTHATRSLALHKSKQIDVITHQNWVQMLLPFLGHESLLNIGDMNQPVAAAQNRQLREVRLDSMVCPVDAFNTRENKYKFDPYQSEDRAVFFARGNYAINGGSHNFQTDLPNTAFPAGDHAHLIMEEIPERTFQMWGNGIAGINKSFKLNDFSNGLSTLVAVEEIRSGIHELDPRGVWSLGQIGGSITWGHGIPSDNFRPNHQWPRADDLLGCGQLHKALGSEKLREERMPCVDYVDLNQQATSRSLHPGGVYCGFLDGSVRFISNAVDPGLWHVMHSRETPENILAADFVEHLEIQDFTTDAPTPESRTAKLPQTLRNSVDMEFILIPAGEFQMGMPNARQTNSAAEECPEHLVRITHPFLMSKCEVTRDQYQRVMDDASTRRAGQSDIETSLDGEFPVTDITWDEAAEFCQHLSLLDSKNGRLTEYRLPTEAEWEYCCRAGNLEPYNWTGHRRSDDRSGDAAGILPPLPVTAVGTYPANAFGLHDMRGNAWEWTADWFDRNYYARSPREDPQGPAEGYLKVVRGSDWRFVGEECHIDYPILPPWKSNPVVGFRVICVLGDNRLSKSKVP